MSRRQGNGWKSGSPVWVIITLSIAGPVNADEHHVQLCQELLVSPHDLIPAKMGDQLFRDSAWSAVLEWRHWRMCVKDAGQDCDGSRSLER